MTGKTAVSVITRIRVPVYEYDLQDFEGGPFQYRKGATTRMRKFVVVIETDDGARGEYAPHYGATPQALAQVEQMAPMLIGRDASHRTRIFEDLRLAFRHFDGVGIAPLDAALWDLAGKQHGLSVASMLGGFRDRLPTYASTFPGQPGVGALCDPAGYADFAQACQEQGFPALKIHAFRDGSAASEIAIMRAIRDHVGDELELMTDPASSLPTYTDTLKVGRACDELGFLWYEDPFVDGSTSAFVHKRLREAISTPLLITEHVRGISQKADFLLAGGTDMLHIDPELDGGVTGTMRLASFASAVGADVQLHTAGPLHRALMAAIPNTIYYELGLVAPDRWNSFQPPIYADGFSDQLDAVGADGCVSVPTGPGLGVEYDWAQIDAWTVGERVFE